MHVLIYCSFISTAVGLSLKVSPATMSPVKYVKYIITSRRQRNQDADRCVMS